MFIKQISVYLENTKGSLRELTELLGKAEINLLALSVADTTDFGIVRCIVKSSDIYNACQILRESGFIVKTNEVICVQIPHIPLSFSGILEILEKNDISVEYSYSFCRSTLADAIVIIRPSDKERCVDILKSENVRVVTQEQVDNF